MRQPLVWDEMNPGQWWSQEGVFYIERVGQRYRVTDLMNEVSEDCATLAAAKRWAAERA